MDTEMTNPPSTHRAEQFGIVKGHFDCWSCGKATPVACVLLAGEHVSRWIEPDESEDDAPDWEQADSPEMLTYLAFLDPEALATVRQSAPWMEFTPSGTAGMSYWGNVCQHCGKLQGDWFLSEPEAPFFPTTDAGIEALEVEWHEQTIEAAAGGAQSSWLDALIQRYPPPKN